MINHGKRTKAEALKTRQELIETAIAQFAQHGVSKTTLNDIADAANVTRGSYLSLDFENEIGTLHEMCVATAFLTGLKLFNADVVATAFTRSKKN
ncbi:hypothetical protein DMI66_12070 [Escherichia coli]|nr:hypothetical protein [Escherichia coli]